MATMVEWTPETYGPRWSNVYDNIDWPEPEAAVEFLAKRVGTGRALELAIGTGRVAIPLERRGVQLEGMDASPEMVEKMRAKDGGKGIPVTIANLADFDLGKQFSLVFLLLNTLYSLQTQDEQIACMQRSAAHLEPGGQLVIEHFMPDPTRFHFHGRAHVYEVGLGHVRIEADTTDRATQHTRENHIEVREDGIKLYPAFLRYVWPSELDLMARLVELEFVEQYGDWDGTPFSKWSDNRIAVYRKPR
jgi:hypothetical protein